MSSIKKLLVVCTGNACRSPMAEGFLNKHLKSEDGFDIVSAGTSAADGFAPTPEAIKVMQEEGIDISSYRSKAFSKDLAKSADIILVMSAYHKELILDRMPDACGKVFLYKEFAGTGGGLQETPDPIGQPLSAYEAVRDEIKLAAEAIAGKLVSR